MFQRYEELYISFPIWKHYTRELNSLKNKNALQKEREKVRYDYAKFEETTFSKEGERTKVIRQIESDKNVH